MSTVPNSKKKYEPVDTREFVDFTDYKELSIENIKKACEKFFEAPQGSCDVLLTDRGPSCYLTEQIVGKKFYYVRFVDPEKNSIKPKKRIHDEVEESTEPSWAISKKFRGSLPQHPYSAEASISAHSKERLPPVPSSAFPKSVSVADLLLARKLVEAPSVSPVTLLLESYNVVEKKWETFRSVGFLKENKHFADGGFRYAFMATTTQQGLSPKWVIKQNEEDQLESITKALGMTTAQHTRKQVQMHAVARSIAHNFIRKSPKDFGLTFHYKKVYYALMNDTPVTVEEFIPGQFFKYINNTGNIIVSQEHKTIIEKAECFVHFSYESTSNQLMVLDLQGVGFQLFDPEIATGVLIEDGENEINFCAGNLSSDAIKTFLRNHLCNDYCQMMGLKENKDVRKLSDTVYSEQS